MLRVYSPLTTSSETHWTTLYVDACGERTVVLEFATNLPEQTFTLTMSTLGSQGSDQVVTAPTILWALLAVVLNAMAQQSKTQSSLLDSGNYREGTLVSLSSSPVVCLLDSGLELVTLAKAISIRFSRRTNNDEESTGDPEQTTTQTIEHTENEPPSRAAIVVRMTMVLLGVLPQAIKVFSMRGMVGSQILVGIFLSTSVLRIIPVGGTRAYRLAAQHVTNWGDEEKFLVYFYLVIFQVNKQQDGRPIPSLRCLLTFRLSPSVDSIPKRLAQYHF